MKIPHLTWKLNKEDLDLSSTNIVTCNNQAAKFPEDYTMTDLQKLQTKVAFHCEQCDRIITNVVCFGVFNSGNVRMRVMCHNQSAMMEVPRADLDGHTHPFPLVMKAFQAKPKFDPKLPNVRFYCQACDSITAQFSYQWTPVQRQHNFVIICSGRICAGKSHARIFDESSLQDFKICDHTSAPVILPIDGNLTVTRKSKMASQKAVPITPPLPLRKLRYE